MSTAPITMNLTTQPQSGRAILQIQAQWLELADRQLFLMRGQDLIESGMNELVLDLSRLENIYAVFIGSMVDLKHKAEAVGKRFIVVASPRVGRTLAAMGLNRSMDIRTMFGDRS